MVLKRSIHAQFAILKLGPDLRTIKDCNDAMKYTHLDKNILEMDPEILVFQSLSEIDHVINTKYHSSEDLVNSHAWVVFRAFPRGLVELIWLEPATK